MKKENGIIMSDVFPFHFNILTLFLTKKLTLGFVIIAKFCHDLVSSTLMMRLLYGLIKLRVW